ncbi:hypothetical protein [Argonema antarcticum]|uniref:hypothetical protein n=1 Tax=Argonema antarcticum TaxID=2942763 RepID=UPI0020115B95|nr:hypothetical protein [Argonema antarcticum]
MELLDHPRPQYCLILAIALIIGGIFRQKWCFFWCLPLSVNLILIGSLFFLPPSHIQVLAYNQPGLLVYHYL